MPHAPVGTVRTPVPKNSISPSSPEYLRMTVFKSELPSRRADEGTFNTATDVLATSKDTLYVRSGKHTSRRKFSNRACRDAVAPTSVEINEDPPSSMHINRGAEDVVVIVVVGEVVTVDVTVDVIEVVTLVVAVDVIVVVCVVMSHPEKVPPSSLYASITSFSRSALRPQSSPPNKIPESPQTKLVSLAGTRWYSSAAAFRVVLTQGEPAIPVKLESMIGRKASPVELAVMDADAHTSRPEVPEHTPIRSFITATCASQSLSNARPKTTAEGVDPNEASKQRSWA